MSELKETGTVLGVAIGGIGVSFTDIEHALRVGVLIGSLIYVWRKALKRRRQKQEEDAE